MVFSIIIIHEFGHLLASYYYKWNLDKISVFPFGGCVKFNEQVNRTIKEEFIILISGPLIQIVYYLFVCLLLENGIITYRNFKIFETYHYALLIFNLLPIYPLDGGRLLNLIINLFMPYKRGNKLVIFVSIIIVLICMYNYQNINFLFMSILLLSELIMYFKRQDYLYNKLLLERYISPKEYKKFKIINNKDSMYKDRRHIILFKNKYITEKQYLNNRFKVIK